VLPNQRLALYEPVLNTDLAVITKHTIKYFDMTKISAKHHRVPNPDAANSYATSFWEPVNGCAGINHSGDDPCSPFPTNKIKPELSGFTKLLKEKGIPFRRITRDSPDIFVKRIYVLVPPENLEQAKEMAKEYRKMDGIRYFYAL